MTPTPRIVVMTGGAERRHERFATRIDTAFPDQVVSWIVAQAPADRSPVWSASGLTSDLTSGSIDGLGQKLRREVIRGGVMALFSHVRPTARSLIQGLEQRQLMARHALRIAEAERALFEGETLRAPSPIWCGLDDPELIARLRGLEPRFLLSLEVPRFDAAVLAAVSGPAFHVDSGCAASWALYHRSLTEPAAVVQRSSPGAACEAPIVARGWPCAVATDTPECYAMRAVALGTELAIQVVRQTMEQGSPPEAALGPTPCGELGPAIRRDIERDFADGWLDRSLRQARAY